MLSPADTAAIVVGGVIGASLRWAVTRPSSHSEAGWFRYEPNNSAGYQPHRLVEDGWQLLLVNVLGCLLLGIVTALLVRTADQHRRRMLLASGTGFCGSLTTFATLMTTTAELLRWPIESPSRAGITLVLHVVVGGAAFWVGRLLVRRTTPPPLQAAP